MAASAPSRRLRVEQIMGTAIGIDLRDDAVPSAAVDEAFAYLRRVDERFSTYRPESELNRLNRGELQLDACSLELRQVLALCEQLRGVTNGYFDARQHRGGGSVDPTGVVKGWAVDAAAWILDRAGARNVAINAGGDILARGVPSPGRRWRVGIRYPEQRDRLAAVLEMADGAVATSGTYERGEHLVDPHSGRPATGLLSLTVVGGSLTFAHAYATAAFAMAEEGPAWVAAQPGYGAVGVTLVRRVIWTPEAWELRTDADASLGDAGFLSD